MKLKKIIPIVIAVILCILFVKYSGKVLEPGEHRPSTILKDEHSIEDVMEGFNFEK